MEEIENIKNELNEIKTARDNIKTALENEGETVTNDIRTYANTIPNVNKVKTVNSVEADTNKNVQLDASKINIDDTAEAKQTIKVAIETLRNDVNNISVPEYSVIETTVTEGYSKTYSLTKDGTEVGVKINIPKDLVVNKGSVKVVATAGTPYDGAVVGDKYLDIELNDPTKDHIYIPVKELVDVYTGKNNNKTHVVIGSDNSIEVQIQSGSIEKTDLKQELQDEITNAPSLIYTDSIPVNTAIQTDLGKYQEMYDTFKSGKDVIFIGSMGGIYQVFLLKKNAPIINNTVAAYSTVNFGESSTNSYSQLNNESYSLAMTINNDTVTSVLVSLAVTKKLNSIDPTKIYTTPFIPTNSGHPATKKYVDDSIVTYTAGRGIVVNDSNAIENLIAPILLDSSDANFNNDFIDMLFNYMDENGEKGTILVFYIDGYEFVMNGNILNMSNIMYLSSNIYNSSYLLINVLDAATNSDVQIKKIHLNPIESILDVSGITSTNRYVELPYTSEDLDVYLNGEKLLCTSSINGVETDDIKNNYSCYTHYDANSGKDRLYFTSDYTIESIDKLVVRQYGVSESYVKG